MSIGHSLKDHPPQNTDHPPLLSKTITNLEEIDSNGALATTDGPSWRQLAREVRRTKHLSDQIRLRLLDELARRYVTVFGPGVEGKPYHQLKNEAVFLAELTKRCLVHMALRLVEIRGRELYREDGYADFKTFVEFELPISRSTAYNYIEIVQYFGVENIVNDEDLEYSKLLPVIPLLKQNDQRIPKERVKQHFLEIAPFRSRREIEREVSALRRRYGIPTAGPCRKVIDPAHILSLVRDNLPSDPTPAERQVLEQVITLIVQSLRTCDERQVAKNP